MKFTILLTLIACLIKTSVYAQQVTLSVEKASLEKVLIEIRKQTGYAFFYDASYLQKATPVSVDVRDVPLRETLRKVFEGQQFSWEILEKTIIIKPIIPQGHLVGRNEKESYPTEGIEGKVTDKRGESMIGVTVMVKGTSIGTQTNDQGQFSFLSLDKGAILVFSYIGYLTKEIAYKDSKMINVLLEEEPKSLDIVVVGYGQQKKTSIVGAISVMDNSNLTRASPANLTNAIAGHVTGAIVRMRDGNIGGGNAMGSQDGTLADADIFIRGRATTNSATPLILVDGVESTFAKINPEDIEQMSVLKDASATAVYGVRGANGVILITTKRGRSGSPKIFLKAETRVHQPLNFPEILGAYEYAYLYNEASRNMGLAERYSTEDLEHWRTGDDPYRHPDIDWRKLLVKDRFPESQTSFNIQGGTDLVKYYVSGEYLSAGGPFNGRDRETYTTNSWYKRYNLRNNLDFNVTKNTVLRVSLNGTIETKNDSNHDDSSGQRYSGSYWRNILNLTTHEYPVFNPNGTFNIGLPPSKSNVYGSLHSGGYVQREINSFQTNVTLEQNLYFLLDGLRFRGMYGGIFNSGSLLTFDTSPAYWSYNADTHNYTLAKPESAPKYVNSNLNPLNKGHFEFALNYNNAVNDIHDLSLMAIYIQTSTTNAFNLPVNYQGVAGRATYGFRNRYLAEFNIGYNGSDQFAKGNRFAVLPALSLGWVLTEESFVKDRMSFFNFLKIRGSYGMAGNDRVGNYRFLYDYKYSLESSRWGAYTKYPGIYEFGETPQDLGKGLREGSLGNDQVTWEIAYKSNVGVDLTMFDSRLTGVFDYFNERRENILVIRSDLPTQTGLLVDKLPAQNAGKVTNRGYEVSLHYKDRVNSFEYSLGTNYSFARNKINYIAEVERRYDYQMAKGHPIGSHFGYTWTGKFYDFDDLADSNVPKPSYPLKAGDLMFKDLNNDGVIDDYDRGVIGYPSIPEMVYGIDVGLKYRGIYANLFFQGAANVHSTYGDVMMNEFSPNVQPIHKGRWVYDPARGLDTRSTATYPSLDINGGSQATREMSTFRLIDSDYVRLKTVEIGYDLPQKWVGRLRFSTIKLYFNGSNILTFNDYKPIDPEYYQGSGGSYFPQTRFYSVGLHISF